MALHQLAADGKEGVRQDWEVLGGRGGYGGGLVRNGWSYWGGGQTKAQPKGVTHHQSLTPEDWHKALNNTKPYKQ